MNKLLPTIKKALILLLIATPLCRHAAAQHTAASRLGQGNWWKMEIANSGVYRIDAATVPALAGAATADIAVFNHLGGQLSELNGESRIDDLEEIPVEIHDLNNNGTIDDGDFVLFYASGADIWQYSSDIQRIVHQNHPYSKSNYAYLTISQGNHQRISTASASSPSGSVITTCTSLALHENDLYNTHKSGQIWVGERFTGTGNHTSVTLTLPAIPTANLKLRYGLASVTTAASSFNVSINGTTRSHAFISRKPYNVFVEEFPASASTEANVSITYYAGENLATAYLDFVEIEATVPMMASSTMATFYVPASDNASHTHRMTGANTNTRVWDITDIHDVTSMAATLSGSQLEFVNTTDKLRSYIVFSTSQALSPSSVSELPNQNLHGAANPDMVIVCHNDLLGEASRLASLHSIHDGLNVLTVTQEQVFNEFSSGMTDPMAIRELMRMFWLRAQQDSSLPQPRHLLLFGRGTYDNKNLLGHNQTSVVTYQTLTSFDDDGGSMATDDLLTFLDDGESGTVFETLDISVGRLPAKNNDEATHIVDKIEQYLIRSDLMQDNIRGDWRNSVALLADDADPSCPGDTVFTNSSEITANLIENNYPQYNIDKIYADAYIQQSGADGSYYPDVNNALKKRLDYGCLLLNYIGHGSAQYIGTERFMMKSDISGYANYQQLPFFVTSTCTFGRYDNPDETCGAEEFLLADGAGIGCVAASRPISHVQSVNTDIVMQSLNPANTIGDAIRITKNLRPTTQALTLIGDPALRLSFPKYRVVVTAINGRPVDSLRLDSAMVLSSVTVEGEIHDNLGNLVSDFDGTIYPEVYDRAVTASTLANDNEGCEVQFSQRNSLLYKGSTSVNGGRFSYHFIVPRDVAYKYERAKLCHYAKSATEDASGAYTNLMLGGYDESTVISECRPDIRLFMGDTNFRNGGITDENPALVALLFDSIGINAVGSGLGHDIVATIDNNPNNIITLNDFYETDINDEHRGSIRYNLRGLSAGRHTITLKAWNIYNFSNSATISFIVRGTDDIATSFNASPNPSSDISYLQMEHNCKGSVTKATLQIFDMRGACVRTFEPTVAAESYAVGPVAWDLRNESGVRVSPGIYIARFTVTTSDGDKLHEQGKIVVK